MPRLMSVSLTEPAVIERRKTVTRRLGWRFLKPGDRLTLCRKVMGRRRADGTVDPLNRLAEVAVVSVRRERLDAITFEDVVAEGFPGWTPFEFIQFFCGQHRDCDLATLVTRIEWRYLDAGRSTCPICSRVWLVTPRADCSLPTCGCYGHDTSAANPARPCEPCGISHALRCERMPSKLAAHRDDQDGDR